MNVLRRIIAPMGSMDAIEFINSKLYDTKNNSDFNSMNKPSNLGILNLSFLHKMISQFLLLF